LGWCADKEEEDGAGEEGVGSAGLKKRKGKLTKAQRNRLRRHKLTQQTARLQREHKALEKQVRGRGIGREGAGGGRYIYLCPRG
jgi:hypothetical protein